MKSILLVDDDLDIQNINSIYLKELGYRCLFAANVQQAYAVIELENPDLIVLDLLLPDGTGIEICQKIRGTTIAPIIFLTSLLDEKKQLEALRIGADDYMTKPYKLAELAARIEANLRRVQMHQSQVYEFFPMTINAAAHRVFLYGEEVLLAQKEFQLLMILIGKRGTIVTKEHLVRQVWGEKFDYETTIKSLQVHLSSLRKKVIPIDSKQINIKTIRNVGYCFEYLTPQGTNG